MAINPYTLNGLYQKGILDYVDPDLCVGMAAAPMSSMQNPYANLKAQSYMNNAMQGNLYKSHGSQGDSFTFNGGNNPYAYQGVGSASNSFTNMFGQTGVGTNYQGSALGFGDPSVGSQATIGIASSFGDPTVGGYYQGGGENAYGGFGDLKNNVSGGMAKATALYNNTPPLLKGLAAIGIGILGVKMLFRGKGKKGGFLSKLNPLNWLSKTKHSVVKPVKTSIWSKLKFWK